MEVYKKLTEAINSIDPNIIYWECPGADDVYDRNALLNVADQLEPIFDPEGLNYYMPFQDGEIKLLLMREGQIMTIFTPFDMPENWQPKAPEEAPEEEAAPEPVAEPALAAVQNPEVLQYRFCPKCGTPITPGAVFCSKCGNKLK